jgi:hypothetical protein
MAPPAEPLRYLGAKRPVITSTPRRKQSGVFGSVRMRAAFACVLVLLLIGAGVGLAGLF